MSTSCFIFVLQLDVSLTEGFDYTQNTRLIVLSSVTDQYKALKHSRNFCIKCISLLTLPVSKVCRVCGRVRAVHLYFLVICMFLFYTSCCVVVRFREFVLPLGFWLSSHFNIFGGCFVSIMFRLNGNDSIHGNESMDPKPL